MIRFALGAKCEILAASGSAPKDTDGAPNNVDVPASADAIPAPIRSDDSRREIGVGMFWSDIVNPAPLFDVHELVRAEKHLGILLPTRETPRRVACCFGRNEFLPQLALVGRWRP